jgi:hypothetical protein
VGVRVGFVSTADLMRMISWHLSGFIGLAYSACASLRQILTFTPRSYHSRTENLETVRHRTRQNCLAVQTFDNGAVSCLVFSVFRLFHLVLFCRG